MKKILLFGSGDGARKFLMKYDEGLDIIAIFDNDTKKHGQEFVNGLKISPPTDIKKYEYDEIIIVSQWAKEIQEQLINDIKVKPETIHIPAKTTIKKASRPFEDNDTKLLAQRIIKELSSNAIKDNISFMVDFGTLLGLVRDNDIIAWDDDVDFSIVNLPDGLNFSEWLVKVLNKIDLPIKLSVKSKLIESKAVSYIIYFDSEKYKYFETSISLRKLKDGNYVHIPSGGMWYAPKKHFDSYEVITWLDTQIIVPYDYKNYLTFLYGNWEKPKKDITMADYANLGTVEYEDFINSGDGYKEIL